MLRGGSAGLKLDDNRLNVPKLTGWKGMSQEVGPSHCGVRRLLLSRGGRNKRNHGDRKENRGRDDGSHHAFPQ
jgi:hypothetical protein